MHYRKIMMLSIVCMGLSLMSCSSKHHVSRNDFVYNGINFGADRDASYQQGVRDGCATTAGNYTKDSDRFKVDKSYRVGWADGRLQSEERVPKS